MYEKIQEAPVGITAIKVKGKVSESDFESIRIALEGDLKEYGKIRMYVEIYHFDGFEISGFWEKIKLGWDVASHFHKAAYLIDKKWVERLTSMANFVTPFDLRTFDLGERDQAYQWLMQDRLKGKPKKSRSNA